MSGRQWAFIVCVLAAAVAAWFIGRSQYVAPEQRFDDTVKRAQDLCDRFGMVAAPTLSLSGNINSWQCLPRPQLKLSYSLDSSEHRAVFEMASRILQK